jgi:hypothetical protein
LGSTQSAGCLQGKSFVYAEKSFRNRAKLPNILTASQLNIQKMFGNFARTTLRASYSIIKVMFGTGTKLSFSLGFPFTENKVVFVSVYESTES